MQKILSVIWRCPILGGFIKAWVWLIAKSEAHGSSNREISSSSILVALYLASSSSCYLFLQVNLQSLFKTMDCHGDTVGG